MGWHQQLEAPLFMGAQLKHLVLISALALGLGVVATHLVSCWIHYLAGTAALSWKWIFAVRPFIAGLSLIGVVLVARRLARAHTMQIQSGILLALGIMVGLGVFVFGPSSATGSKYLCKGLAQRIQGHGLEKLMNQHLQSLVSANPSKQTEERYEDVTQQSPAWIRERFPEKTLVVEFLNGASTHVRVRAGGPYLRYGYYVGSTPFDVPGSSQYTVVQNVNSNIVVFVQ